MNGLLLAAEVRNLVLLNHGGHHITDQSSLFAPLSLADTIPAINFSQHVVSSHNPPLFLTNFFSLVQRLHLPNTSPHTLGINKFSEQLVVMGSQQVELEEKHEKLQHSLEDIIMELHRKSEFSEFHKLLLRDFTLQRRSYFLSVPPGLIEERERDLSEESGSGNGGGGGAPGGAGSGSNSGSSGSSSNSSSQNGFFGIHSPLKNSLALRSRSGWGGSVRPRLRKSPKQDASPLNSSSSSGVGLNLRLSVDFRLPSCGPSLKAPATLAATRRSAPKAWLSPRWRTRAAPVCSAGADGSFSTPFCRTSTAA